MSSGTVSTSTFASIERPLGAITLTFSSTASTSSAAGEGPTRTWPFWWPSASTPPATGRSSAARRATPSPADSWREFFSWLRARALRRAARHRRQVRGDARCARMFPGARYQRCRSLLPKRVGKGARDQEEGRGARAEGDSRAGIARGVLEEGGGGGGRAGRR